jgi:hypothetical protein
MLRVENGPWRMATQNDCGVDRQPRDARRLGAAVSQVDSRETGAHRITVVERIGLAVAGNWSIVHPCSNLGHPEYEVSRRNDGHHRLRDAN